LSLPDPDPDIGLASGSVSTASSSLSYSSANPDSTTNIRLLVNRIFLRLHLHRWYPSRSVPPGAG